MELKQFFYKHNSKKEVTEAYCNLCEFHYSHNCRGCVFFDSCPRREEREQNARAGLIQIEISWNDEKIDEMYDKLIELGLIEVDEEGFWLNYQWAKGAINAYCYEHCDPPYCEEKCIMHNCACDCGLTWYEEIDSFNDLVNHGLARLGVVEE